MSVFCVNTKSKEFLSLVKELNVHPSVLEMHIFSYLNSPESLLQLNTTGELPFPSTEYLRNKLYKTNNNKVSIKDWVAATRSLDYGNKTFDTLEEAELAGNNLAERLNIKLSDISIFSTNDNHAKLIFNRPKLNSWRDLRTLLESAGIINTEDGKSKLIYDELDNRAYFDSIDYLSKFLNDIGIDNNNVYISNGIVTFNESFNDNSITINKEYYQLPIVKEYSRLHNIQYTCDAIKNMKVDFKTFMQHHGITDHVIEVILQALYNNKELGKLTPGLIFASILKEQNNDMFADYMQYIGLPAMDELEKYLTDFLKKYHIEVKEDGLAELKGVTGVFDILQKTIHLAKNRNAITMTEEFAHAFVELMGSNPSTKNESGYTELFELIEHTDLYSKVYEHYKNIYTKTITLKDGTQITIPDEHKIKKEAIGLALAIAINNKWTHPETIEQKEKGFWTKLKSWFNGILDAITKFNNMFTSEDDKYDLGSKPEDWDIKVLLDKIANDILTGDTSRLLKINSKNYSLLNYSETLAMLHKVDGGKALDFLKTLSQEFGAKITGSLSYRREGTVYRGKQDLIHDIDASVDPNVHNINILDTINLFDLLTMDYEARLRWALHNDYIKKILDRYPDMELTTAYAGDNLIVVSTIYSEDKSLRERFLEAKGSYADRLANFTDEERKLIYLFDFFLEATKRSYTKDLENNINYTTAESAFSSKLKYGRDKDVFDYQVWQKYPLFKRDNISNEDYLMYQVLPDIINYDLLNEEQKNTVKIGLDYILNKKEEYKDKDYMLITGQGGTGKTSLINPLLVQLEKELGRVPKVTVGAVAHTASLNLYNKIIPKYRGNRGALAGILGFKPNTHKDAKLDKWITTFEPTYNIGKNNKDGLESIDKNKYLNCDLLIIDECSMIDDQYVEYINKIKEYKQQLNPNFRVIFLGDNGLIDPILKDEIEYIDYDRNGRGTVRREFKKLTNTESVVFQNPNKIECRLTLQNRQGDNSPITLLANKFWLGGQNTDINESGVIDQINDLWETRMLRGETPRTMLTDKGGVIATVANKETLIDYAIPLIELAKQTKNPYLFKYITFHKETAKDFNNLIWNYFHKLSSNTYELDCKKIYSGDIIMSLEEATPAYSENSATPINIYNATNIVVKECSEIIDLNTDSDISQYNLSSLYTVQAALAYFKSHSRNITIPMQIVTFDTKITTKNGEERTVEVRMPVIVPGKTKEVRATVSKYLLGAPAAAKWRDVILLNIGSIEYAYALDTHKAQGSTYDVVIVDTTGYINQQENSVYFSKKTIKDAKDPKHNDAFQKERIAFYEQYSDSELEAESKKLMMRSFYTAMTRASNLVVLSGAPGSWSSGLSTIARVTGDNSKLALFNYNNTINKNRGKISEKEYQDLQKQSQESEDVRLNKTWNDYLNYWDSVINEARDTVKFDESTHTYSTKTKDGMWIDSVLTASLLLDDITKQENTFLKVSSLLGTATDHVLRDYLLYKQNPSKYEDPKKKNYNNLTSSAVENIIKCADEFYDYINKKANGKRFKIITDEIPLIGLVGRSTKDPGLVTGGTPDCIVIYDDGTYEIWDFKTFRSNGFTRDAEKKVKYLNQVNTYRLLLGLMFPELKSLCKGGGIFLLLLNYAEPSDSVSSRSKKYEYNVDNGIIKIGLDNGNETIFVPITDDNVSSNNELISFPNKPVREDMINPIDEDLINGNEFKRGAKFNEKFPKISKDITGTKVDALLSTNPNFAFRSYNVKEFTLDEINKLSTPTTSTNTDMKVSHNTHDTSLNFSGNNASITVATNRRRKKISELSKEKSKKDIIDTVLDSKSDNLDNSGTDFGNIFRLQPQEIQSNNQLSTNVINVFTGYGAFNSLKEKYRIVNKDSNIIDIVKDSLFLNPFANSENPAWDYRDWLFGAKYTDIELDRRYAILKFIDEDKLEDKYLCFINTTGETDINKINHGEVLLSINNNLQKERQSHPYVKLTESIMPSYKHIAENKSKDKLYEDTKLSEIKKTESGNVTIDTDLKLNYEDWQSNNPNGIVAYRIDYNNYNSKDEVNLGHIGNPFSEDTLDASTVEQFYNWLITGNNYNNSKATEEFRLAIIDKLISLPKNTPILYYKEWNRVSHANIIDYLINHKDLLLTNSSYSKTNANNVTSAEPISNNIKVTISTDTYANESVADNPDIAYIFTDNGLAYVAAQYALDNMSLNDINLHLPSNAKSVAETPIFVSSGKNGTNLAVIRARKDDQGNVIANDNAYGIVVKKWANTVNGGYVRGEGNFLDTDLDYAIYTLLIDNMFNRLSKDVKLGKIKEIRLPSSMALGKASLPGGRNGRFVTYLVNSLHAVLNIDPNTIGILANTNKGYEGFGIILNSAVKVPNINIYSGSKDKWSTLSNLAPRLFTAELFEDDKHTYHSVEQAFQYAKYKIALMYYTGVILEFNSKNPELDTEINDILHNFEKLNPIDDSKAYNEGMQAVINATDGKKARTAGQIYKIDSKFFNIWNGADANSLASKVLKAIIKASLEGKSKESKAAKLTLLDTGVAKLTHNISGIRNNVYENTFPQILMDIRSELFDEGANKLTINDDRYSLTSYRNLSKELKDKYLWFNSTNSNLEVKAYIKNTKDGESSNEVLIISIKDQPEKGFFELVHNRAFDGLNYGDYINEYSLHFKTASKAEPNNKYASKILTDLDKKDLFKTVLQLVPEGGIIVPYGTLSKGSIHAILTLNERYADGILEKVDEKTLQDKLDNLVTLPVWQKKTEGKLYALALDFTLHSGGAIGSDLYWDKTSSEYGLGFARHYYIEGHKIKDFTLNIALSELDVKEAEVYVNAASVLLDKSVGNKNVKALLLRDYAQAKYSDAIYAVSTLAPGNVTVEGGTGWTVAMGCLMAKPIYVFDLNLNKWFYAHYDEQGNFTRFREYNNKETGENLTPVLTKNFAGIGSRNLTKEGLRAIEEVCRKSFTAHGWQENVNELIDNSMSDKEYVKSVIQIAKSKLVLDDVLNSISLFYTPEEVEAIKKSIGKIDNNGNTYYPVKVMSASRHSDPVFFADKVILMIKDNYYETDINKKKQAIEIWTKHDGVPLVSILKACKEFRLAPMLSFSITSLGNSDLEKGVMKYNDLLDRILELINLDLLNPETTTIRIDPIVPGVTLQEDITNIINRAREMGINKFVTSMMQSYAKFEGNTEINPITGLPNDRGIIKAFEKTGRTRDNYWNTYYGIKDEKTGNYETKKIKVKDKDGKVKEIEVTKLSHFPLPEITKKWGDYFKNLMTKFLDLNIKACSDRNLMNFLDPAACLDPEVIKAVTGIDSLTEDGKQNKDKTRKECQCYGSHGDVLSYNDLCLSMCLYCYGALNDNSNLEYYDDEGHLLDNEYTTTTLSEELENEIIKRDLILQTYEEKWKAESKVTNPDNIYSDKEKTLIKEREALLNSGLFSGPDLLQLANAAIFKLSAIISELQENKENNLKYFKQDSPLASTDFTKMNRIEILNVVGMNNLFEIVKNTIFNERRELNGKRPTLGLTKKLKAIKLNWNAFLELTLNTLMQTENVSFKDGSEAIDTSLEDILGGDALEVAEEEGNTVETWQIGFRQISAHNSLSLELKRFLASIDTKDLNGDKILDDFRNYQKIDEREAVNKILLWCQGSMTLSDMILKLELHVSEDSWVQDVLNKLKDDNENDTFKSLFFSNFRKYFQPYIILYIDKSNGQLVHKIINNRGLENIIMEQKQLDFQLDNFENMPFIDKDTGTINSTIGNDLKAKAQSIVNYMDNFKKEVKDIDGYSEIFDKIVNILVEGIESLGLLVDRNVIEALNKGLAESLRLALYYIGESFDNDHHMGEKYNPFVDKSYNSRWLDLFKIVANNNINLESVSYEGGKMHYSYVIPSALSNMVDKLKGKNTIIELEYQEMLENEFGKYLQFKYIDARGEERYRLEILNMLANNTNNAREQFGHFVVLTSLGINYRDKSPLLYLKSIIQGYTLGDTMTTSGKTQGNIKHSRWGLFRVPMMSNKPSEEYIRLCKYTDEFYKESISKLIIETIRYECERILAATILESQGRKIDNLSDRGKKFVMVEFMQKYYEAYLKYSNNSDINYNDILNDNSLSQELINEIAVGQWLWLNINKHYDSRLNDDTYTDRLYEVIDKELTEKYNVFRDFMEKEGILETTKDGKYKLFNNLMLGVTNSLIDNNLEKFFWNDYLASLTVLLLTVGDTAFYAGVEDLQKRLALIHAPGIRGNIEAKWENAIKTNNGIEYRKSRVSDGITRTLYLKDFDHVVSDAIETVKTIFDQKYNELLKINKEEAKVYKEASNNIIVQFKNINVTDALAYSSITSYRKKAVMFGKWSDSLELTYRRIREGNYSIEDLLNSLLPLKPFVYSNETVNINDPEATLKSLKMGVQNKNSEYLLILMDAIIRGEDNVTNGKSDNINKSKLAAIYDFMEESHYDKDGNYKVDGIDTVQFESTVKTGGEGKININDAKTTLEAKLILENNAYVNGRGSAYNMDVVHHLRFEDYCLQSEVPAHLEGESIFGSLIRMLILADMPHEYDDGSPVMINYKGTLKPLAEVKQNYLNAVKDNIYNSFLQLVEELKLTGTTVEKNIALSRLLLETIRKDAKYGYDMLYAVSTDENGNFNLPLSDPTMTIKILQLLNSIIKSRINKQEIPGGPVVLVTNFGTSTKLSIKFQGYDKDGNLVQLKTFQEFYEESKTNKDMEFDDLLNEEKKLNSTKLKKATKAYKEYLNLYKDVSISHFECYAPSTVFKKYADENGYIDINKIPKDELEIIGFRIPTEAKYSMIPMKIVGVLPTFAGEGIMLPYELTLLTGSDFDMKYVKVKLC